MMGRRTELLNRFVVASHAFSAAGNLQCWAERSLQRTVGRGRASFAWEHLIQGQDPKKQGEWSSAVHCKCIEVFALGYSQSITSLKAFQSSLKETLGLPTPSHTWSASRQPLAGEKGMSSLFSEEVCFESQCNLTPWIRRDSARGLRQKYIPFLKWLGKSSNLCGKAGEMAGEKRKMTCISGLCLPDIYKLWVMQLRGDCSHSKEAAWFKRAGGLQFALWFNPQIKLPSRGWISGRNLGVHF